MFIVNVNVYVYAAVVPIVPKCIQLCTVAAMEYSVAVVAFWLMCIYCLQVLQARAVMGK